MTNEYLLAELTNEAIAELQELREQAVEIRKLLPRNSQPTNLVEAVKEALKDLSA